MVNGRQAARRRDRSRRWLRAGIRLQAFTYPGGRVLSGSERADQWTQALGRQFHEVRIDANGHHISLVFAELTSSIVLPGYVPFVVGDT